MKCHKCGNDMQAGYLQSDMKVGITWVSKPVAFGFGWWKKDSVTVSEETVPGLSVVPAHICKSCKVFFGDFSNKAL